MGSASSGACPAHRIGVPVRLRTRSVTLPPVVSHPRHPQRGHPHGETGSGNDYRTRAPLTPVRVLVAPPTARLRHLEATGPGQVGVRGCRACSRAGAPAPALTRPTVPPPGRLHTHRDRTRSTCRLAPDAGASRRATPHHRRHRLHRRPAGPAPARRGGRRLRPLPRPGSRQAAGRAVGAPGRGGARRPARSRERAARLRGRRRRLLPRALAGARTTSPRSTAAPRRSSPRRPATPACGASSTSAACTRTATLSTHLASRREVGEILMASGVPTAVLQAAVVIGSGSASFEMLRYLTERLPVMVTPRWVAAGSSRSPSGTCCATSSAPPGCRPR